MNFRILFLALVCVASAHAEFPPEEGYLAPKSLRQKPQEPRRPVRPARPKVLRQTIEDDVPPPPDGNAASYERPFRIGMGVGYNGIHSGDTTNDTLLGTYFLNDSFAIKGNAEFQFTSIFGVEAEGSYAYSPTNTLVINTVEETRQLKQTSLLFGVRAQYPLVEGRSVWKPRVLLGYGMTSESQTSGRAAGTTVESLAISGAYVGAGLEMELERALVLYLDAVFSLGGSGSYTKTGPTTGNLALSGPSYNRFRLGGLLRLLHPISLGAEIAYRTYSSNVAAQTDLVIGQRDSSFQALALVSVDF